MARRISSPVFVGRDDELERLGAMLASAMAGRPGSVVIAGEAGVGKTRLVVEFARAAHDAGARVLRGAAVPVGEGSLAYGPVVDAVRAVVRAPDRSPDGRLLGSLRRELASLLPGLGPPTVPPAEASSGGAAYSPVAGLLGRERLLELLLATLDRLSTDAPTVVVLEDLHWADRATLDAITFLHRSMRDQRVLLVLTIRSDDPGASQELRTVLAELDRVGRTEWLDLERLDLDALGRMLAGIMGHDANPRTVLRIHARSGGNAYYAEELLALGGEDGPLPSTLRDVLLARIDGLDERGRSLLRVASAMGPRFDGGLVSLVDGLDREAALAALRDAAARHVVVPVEGAGETFEFRHVLLAEAVYADLLPADRIRLHLAWARVLEARSGERSERAVQAELARHWREAGDLPRAFAASIRAGLAARADHVYADARTQLERALELWPQVPEAPSLAGMDRPALLEHAAEVAHAAGSPTAAAEHLREAIALLDPSADPVRVGLLEERLAFALLRAGDPEASRAARVEAYRLVPDEPGSAARARVLAAWARESTLLGWLEDGAELATRAVELARAADARGVEADALTTLGAAQGHLGDLEGAFATLRQARVLAAQAGSPLDESRARMNHAGLFEGEACVREALAAAEWSDRVGLVAWGDFGRCLAAYAMLELGRWDDAERTLDRVRSSGPEGSLGGFERWDRAALDIGRGRLDDAEAAIERIWSDVSSADRRSAFGALGLEAQLALARRRWSDARDATRRAVTELASQGLGEIAFSARHLRIALRAEAEVAEARRARGEEGTGDPPPSAREALELARSTAAAMTGIRAVHWRRPAAVLALCEAEWTRLEGRSDADAWAAAADACTSNGQHALRPYALLRQAEAMLAPGRGRDAAGRLVREAHELATAMGAAPLLADLEALARRARIDLRAIPAAGASVPSEPPDPFGLTRRERDVLVLVAAGRTNREIAEALFITEGTASVHVSNILGKLGVARRTEAAAVAVRLGLAD